MRAPREAHRLAARSGLVLGWGCLLAGPLIGQPRPDPAVECRLPATTTVERSRVRLPVGGTATAVTVQVDGREAGTWRRRVDDRSATAEVAIDPALEEAKGYQLTATFDRPPLPRELDSLRAWLERRVATSTPLDPIGLERELEASLAPACGSWNVPALRPMPPSLAAREAARDSVTRRRADEGTAARHLGAAIAAGTAPTGALARLRAQATGERGGTAREIRTIDEVLAVTAEDTTVAGQARVADRLTRAEDLLATWHARRPPSISAATIDSARSTVAALTEAGAALTTRRAAVAAAGADSVVATRRLAADLRAALDPTGTVRITLVEAVTLPVSDAGQWRVGLGLNYTAPIREPVLGYPGATNRIFPDLFVHWSPPGRGTRRPVTIDFGLALGSLGRRAAARDLFWRSSLLLGMSVHPKGLLRIGAGTQIVRERVAGDQDRLRFPLYVALSVAQFKL
jgi:hypothetical protein